MDTSHAIDIDDAEAFASWFARKGPSEREVVVAIFKKASGKQTVTFDELLDVALCHGWIDVQGQRIDEERWAIRFTPRRPGSNWSERNRARVRKLIDAGRMTPAGSAALPPDL
jgi:uncharacterized protein YdeI (YjbR/CyaY-like superfamily)